MSGYKYAIDKFQKFCEKFNENSTTCSPTLVVKYIRHLHESGFSYQSINHQRSAISKFHEGVQGQPVGMHPLVKQALRAAFHLTPPFPSIAEPLILKLS